MLFSPTLPAKTTQEVMLKRKMQSNANAGKATLMLSNHIAQPYTAL